MSKPDTAEAFEKRLDDAAAEFTDNLERLRAARGAIRGFVERGLLTNDLRCLRKAIVLIMTGPFSEAMDHENRPLFAFELELTKTAFMMVTSTPRQAPQPSAWDNTVHRFQMSEERQRNFKLWCAVAGINTENERDLRAAYARWTEEA